MEKNEYVDINEIDLTGTLIGTAGYKPQYAVILTCIGAALLCLTRNWIAIGLAGFLTAISLFVNYKVQERKTVGIYKEFLIIYDSDDDNKAQKINLDDIVEWTCKNGTSSADALYIKLKDGKEIYKNTFQIGKMFRCMNKCIPDKESARIKEEENKNKKLKFSIPKWPFGKNKDKE